MADDIQLLREYSTGGSQEAFGRLVERYLNLVYSAALHQTGGNQTMSADISQTVLHRPGPQSLDPSRNGCFGWLAL